MSQFTAIVEDSRHFDGSVRALPIKNQMARIPDPAIGHPVPAQRDVVRPRPVDHKFRAFRRAGPFMITQRLAYESAIANGGVHPEIPQAAFQNTGDIAPGSTGNAKLTGAILRHYFRSFASSADTSSKI